MTDLPLEYGHFQTAAEHRWGMLQLARRAKLAQLLRILMLLVLAAVLFRRKFKTGLRA